MHDVALVHAWVVGTWQKGSKLDDFSLSNGQRFTMIDIKLARGLKLQLETATHLRQLKADVDIKTNELMKEGKLMSGRYALWIG